MKKKEVLSLSDYALDKVVKIQGTKFDRKRKLSDKTISKMKYLSACGYSASRIAKTLGTNYVVVKYHTDPEYRYRVNHKGGSHSHGEMDLQNRAEYKRGLVSANAHVIYPMD